MIDRAGRLPGVQSAAMTNVLPVACNCDTDWVRFVGRPYNGIHNEVNQREVSPGLFTTLHARLKSGRYFTDADDSTKPNVVIINEAFARKYFPGEDPIGKKMGDTELTPKSIQRDCGRG